MIRDSAIIDVLSGANSLRDALLTMINVHQKYGNPTVELTFKGRAGSEFDLISIIFTEVIEFEFYYQEDIVFLNIWDLKFLELPDRTFYISLDPDPSTLPSAGISKLEPSDTDHFFVRARHIEARMVVISKG